MTHHFSNCNSNRFQGKATVKQVFLIAITCCLTSLGGLAGVERTASQIEAARTFKIDGVYLGMTYDEFYNLYPSRTSDTENTDTGPKTTCFKVSPTANTDTVSVAFYKGNALSLNAFYFKEQLDKIGGGVKLLERLAEKLGDPEDYSPGRVEGGSTPVVKAFWRVKDANFFLQAIIGPQDALIIVTDTTAKSERDALKNQDAKTGF